MSEETGLSAYKY